MEDLKRIVADNITSLRKNANLTQLEMAEKLNYSDKAISKWERAESIPDVVVMYEIAKLFDVDMNYLVEEDHTQHKPNPKVNKGVILGISVALVFLIAFVCFAILEFCAPKYPSWTVLMFSIPVASVVWLVLNSVWFNKKMNYIIISILIWTVTLTLFVSLLNFINVAVWQIFLITIVGQIIVFMWSKIKK